jgi:hypothetical protein
VYARGVRLYSMRPPPAIPFRCPVCGCTQYVQVRVRRSSGDWYVTSFYECFACSVMFLDPEKFSRAAGDGVDRSPRSIGPLEPP